MTPRFADELAGRKQADSAEFTKMDTQEVGIQNAFFDLDQLDLCSGLTGPLIQTQISRFPLAQFLPN